MLLFLLFESYELWATCCEARVQFNDLGLARHKAPPTLNPDVNHIRRREFISRIYLTFKSNFLFEHREASKKITGFAWRAAGLYKQFVHLVVSAMNLEPLIYSFSAASFNLCGE